MICEKCNKMIHLCALSQGKCVKCGEPTPTPHLPSYKVCKRCSMVQGLCEQCGNKVK